MSERWHLFLSHKRAVFGAAVILLEFTLMFVAPLVAPFDPVKADISVQLLPPGPQHLLGTDNLGLDIFSRILYAPRTDLTIAVGSVLLAFAVGVPIGTIVGFYQRWWSAAFLRMLDLLQAFPIFVLALALVAVTGNRVSNVILVLAALNVPIFVRLVRSDVLSLRNREFVDAAKCAGRRSLGIVFGHMLPNAIKPAIIQTSVSIGWTILLTAGLSFVGAGVRVPTPEWGLMVSQGARNMITGEWWIALFPGLAIGLTVFSFAALGDAMEVILDV